VSSPSVARSRTIRDQFVLTYLTFDSLSEGIGASQVLAYVEGLALRGMEVVLHSFEKVPPPHSLVRRLDTAGAQWVQHQFGPLGARGGVGRVARGITAVRGSGLVHARSDLPAASTLLAGCPTWIWDMRGFWADERVDAGLLRPGSFEERAVRLIERRAARSAFAIVTLSSSAIPTVARMYGPDAANKVKVITTCVDLEQFAYQPMSDADPVRLLLSGTLSKRYDVPTMLRFAEQLRRSRRSQLDVLCPDVYLWKEELAAVTASVRSVEPEGMPYEVGNAHVGLCILKRGGSVANRGTMPTKIGELLATGRPVVVNEGLGDMDELLARYDCGVVIGNTSDEALEQAVQELLRLLADPETSLRCRALAEDHFSLSRGLDTLMAIYQAVARSA